MGGSDQIAWKDAYSLETWSYTCRESLQLAKMGQQPDTCDAGEKYDHEAKVRFILGQQIVARSVAYCIAILYNIAFAIERSIANCGTFYNSSQS